MSAHQGPADSTIKIVQRFSRSTVEFPDAKCFSQIPYAELLFHSIVGVRCNSTGAGVK